MVARWVAYIVIAAAWQSPDPRPQFDAASIKLNVNCGGRRGRGYGLRNNEYYAPSCVTMRTLIRQAFAPQQDTIFRPTDVLGGATWLDTEVYDVAARAGNIGTMDRWRAMLQRFLEDKCDLRFHRETKEVPVYTLTVAKGGPKIQPSKPGNCRPMTQTTVPELAADEPKLPFCDWTWSVKGGTIDVTGLGVTMDQLATGMLDGLDRLVVNRTGLAGIFDVHLEYAAETAPREPDPTGPSVFTAVQQLGLKLSPDKGNVEVLVVDHMDKPSDN